MGARVPGAAAHRRAIGGGHHDVAGFEIAVDHAALVGGVDRIGDGAEHSQPQFEFVRCDLHRTLLEPRIEGLALDQFHGEERFVVTGATCLVDRGDVGVFEAGQGCDFTFEHSHPNLVDRGPLSHHFEGHAPAGLLLLGFVDHAHAALAKPPQDAVAADRIGQVAGGGGDRVRSFGGTVAFQRVVYRLRQGQIRIAVVPVGFLQFAAVVFHMPFRAPFCRLLCGVYRIYPHPRLIVN